MISSIKLDQFEDFFGTELGRVNLLKLGKWTLRTKHFTPDY